MAKYGNGNDGRQIIKGEKPVVKTGSGQHYKIKSKQGSGSGDSCAVIALALVAGVSAVVEGWL